MWCDLYWWGGGVVYDVDVMLLSSDFSPTQAMSASYPESLRLFVCDWKFVCSMFKWTGHKRRRGSGRIACVWVLFMWRVIFIYFWCNTFLWYICCCFFLLFFPVVFFKCQGSDSFKCTDLNKRCDLRLLFMLQSCSKYSFSLPLKQRKSCLYPYYFSFFGQKVSQIGKDVKLRTVVMLRSCLNRNY